MNFNKLREYQENLESRFGIPATDLIVMKDHKVIYRHMCGYSDFARSMPVNANDLYRLFSATKIITATAAMQLVERGKLRLFDRLDTYLPEFAAMRVVDAFSKTERPIIWPKRDARSHIANHPIRIIDLITMSAGFSYDLMAETLQEEIAASNHHATTREMITALSQMPLLYEPGTGWAYSLAHDVLAAVIEVVSGEQYSEYLRHHVFGPLGVDDFYFHPDAKTRERIAAFYQKDRSGRIGPDDGGYSNSFVFTDRYESGGAGLITTVDAYSTVLDALANGGVGGNGVRILKEDTVHLFSTHYTTDKCLDDFIAFRQGRDDYGYGLGVRVHIKNTETNRSPLGEFGWDGAAGAYALVDTENKLCVFYAQHMMQCVEAFAFIHPAIRDLVYECLETDT